MKSWANAGARLVSAVATLMLAGVVGAGVVHARTGQREADARAERLVEQMTLDERLTLLRGYQSHSAPASVRPQGMPLSAGFVPGVPRLGIPALVESDAALGVANMAGIMRPNDVATALPSGAAMASTWNPDLIERAGAMMGSEARAKGFNVLLAGSVNLVREPRNGRNFEYLGEDPLLAGVLVGHSIRGVQSNGIISTIKHFALNAQETGRNSLSANIDEAAFRESDLLAFQIGIEIGDPGSVMCAYNRVDGAYACENSFLLNDVLRRDWGYRGFVMSDWGAVYGPTIRKGLDQESGTRANTPPYFSTMLRDELAAGRVSEEDINRSAHRIVRTMIAHGLVDQPVLPGGEIDYEANATIAQQVAEQGIVVLQNQNALLPLAASAQRILLVGGHADVGVLAGGGSSQVMPYGGVALNLPVPGGAAYHRRFYMPSSPLAALRAELPAATISYDDGSDHARAAEAARAADVVIVFAEQFTAEGRDFSLTLPDNADGLIDAVAAANPRTVVVLVTGGPVLMPWRDRVGAIVAAWYPGQRGGHALARILSGAVNPSGRLPFSFPASEAQLPHPVLTGSGAAAYTGELYDLPANDTQFDVNYVEGADVGYRWYDKTNATPMYAFGYGLSYTTFAYSDLRVRGGRDLSVTFRLENTGQRAGAEVAQVYARVNGVRRLVGWRRVELAAGQSQRVTVRAEPRILADFDALAHEWRIDAGSYAVEISSAANAPQLTGSAQMGARRLDP